jgi:hypothetical protein
MKTTLDKLMGDTCAKCHGEGEIEDKECDLCGGLGYSLANWRIHDLRRTAATGMARAGADLHVIERALNHVSGSFGGIVSVYQKHKFSAEVKSALEAWANLVTSIIEDRRANVTPIRQREG